MEIKKTAKSYSPEVKERAVRMVLEHQGGHASQWAAICVEGGPNLGHSAAAKCRLEAPMVAKAKRF
jgi:hypothetical protein